VFGLRKKRRPIEVVDIAIPSMKSAQGKYFIGQTEMLEMAGQQQNAWGGLFNPADSGIDLFFDIFTITNFSSQYYNAEIWLQSKQPGGGAVSPLIHPANLALQPPPEPKAELRYGSRVQGMPLGGVNVFNRIVPPNTTLISDSSKGGIVVPPGGSFAIFLKSPGPFAYEAKIVFSWWEDASAGGGSL